ncbi:DUF2156 domain-containing protein [Microbacteriaceae bacterium VKM Ac-2855]|nr:DUF2156 domain-containing protein [Microbacteriaceae bacterium VKM Ac-2855]
MKNRLAALGLERLRRFPVSIAIALVVPIAGLLGASASSWGAGVSSTITGERPWTAITALLAPADAGGAVLAIVAALLLLPIAERAMGSLRTILAVVLSGAGAVLIGTLVQWVGADVGEWWASDTSTDLTLDPLIGVVGALLTGSAFLGPLWRRRVRVATVSVVTMFVLYAGDSADVYRLLAAGIGLVLGRVLAADSGVRSHGRSSHRESRGLLAAIVAVTAIGPLVAVLSDSGYGPFSFLGRLLQNAFSGVDPMNPCSVAEGHCLHHVTLALIGPGPILLTFVPLVLLLVAAAGLRRGRRLALLLAIGVNAAIALLDLLSLRRAAAHPEFEHHAEYVLWVATTIAVPVAVIIALMLGRRHVRLRAPRPAVRRWSAIVLLVWLGSAALYAAVALGARDSFVPTASVLRIVREIVVRYIPLSFAGFLGSIAAPEHPFARVVFDWIGPMFWLVVVVAVFALFRATDAQRSGGDAARFRALLARFGGGTLGYQGTWSGNDYWIAPDGGGAVAYRVVGDVAIALSDPVCRPDDRAATVGGFVAFCDDRSWSAVFYSVHDELLPVFATLGWQHTSVGEETLIRPAAFDLGGKRWQKVRYPLTRAGKLGIEARWTTWQQLPLGVAAQVTDLSERWVAEKALPEMGFTLGGLDELRDPEVALMLAIGPDGIVQAVTSWLPVHEDGRMIGWTLDFMRRADDSMPGVMEFLIASVALRSKEDGLSVLSLSGAPLATAPDAEVVEPTPLSRLLDFLSRALEPAYGFTSLFRFKAKFHPEYARLSMAYPDPLRLPQIGAALARTYLPEVSPREALALVRTLRAPRS